MKIYVGNINFRMTEDDLRDMFAEFGEVEDVAIITDRETGRSRGFAFVTISGDEAGNKAIAEVNGKETDGRTLVANEARPRENRGGGGGGGGGGRGGYRR